MPLLSSTLPDGHSHWQVVVFKVWLVGQPETQLPLHGTCPLGHPHSQVSGSSVPPPVQLLTQRPPQRVLPSGQPQTLSSPRLTQFFEQHWRSLRHLRPKRLQSSSAKATPGTEANVAPRRAPPTNLIALPLERVPVASPLASSSKERLVVCWLTRCPLSQRAEH